MLTVYSTHGSPGASTFAVYLAAQWASSGRAVVLIETDPTAGSLSQKLGIQFTPGTASFVAADRPVTVEHLIEHTQDVLFNNFHVMPTPSGPSGARTVAEKFSRLGEELRDISDREMAIIVDGGRLTADTCASELTTSAAAVLVVAHDEAHLSSCEHISGALVDDPSLPGPLGLVATVGPSPLTEAEWSTGHGLTLVGSVDLDPERGTDLLMFTPRGKRKARKLRGSLEKLADTLYEYACPASAAVPRVRLPANRPEIDEGPAEAAEGPTQAGPDSLMAEAPPPVASPSPSSQPAAAAAMPPAAAPPRTQPPPYPQPPYPQPYPQPGYEQPYPQHDYPQPPPYPQPGYVPQEHGHDSESAPPYYRRPTPPAMEPPAAPPLETPAVPSGSFRSWAADLFGESAGGDPDEKRSRPGATA